MRIATNITTAKMMNPAATGSTHEASTNEMANGTTAVPITAANHAGLKYRIVSRMLGRVEAVSAMRSLSVVRSRRSADGKDTTSTGLQSRRSIPVSSP